MPEPYQIDQADAVYLLALLRGEDVPARDSDELLELLKETLKLSKSIADNCNEWLQIMGIIEGDIPEHKADQLNCPTLEGALAGAIVIPRIRQDCGMRDTCAFRIGSPANQVESTADDILHTIKEHEMFYCHHHDRAESDSAPCKGYLEHTKQC